MLESFQVRAKSTIPGEKLDYINIRDFLSFWVHMLKVILKTKFAQVRQVEKSHRFFVFTRLLAILFYPSKPSRWRRSLGVQCGGPEICQMVLCQRKTSVKS